jgi:hypothetical protein
MKRDEPVNLDVHSQLLAQSYTFVESRWENEFAVSVYRSLYDSNRIKRVEQSGKILDGDRRPR